MCPYCTTPLGKSVKREKINSELEVVICRCGRKYMYEISTETYKKTDYDPKKAQESGTGNQRDVQSPEVIRRK